MDESDQVSPVPNADDGPSSAKDRSVVSAGRAALVTANFLVAGLSGLIAIWAVGPGEVLLLVLFGVAITVFSGQLALFKLRARERQRMAAIESRHRAELAAVRRSVAAMSARASRSASGIDRSGQAEQELHALRSALLDTCNGYPPLYRDTVELTYVVGAGDEQDVVIEQRDTVPGPGGLPFLLCRLTAPTDTSLGAPALRDLDLVSRTSDDQISIRPFAISERPGLLRCIYLFAPSLTRRTIWLSRYRMPRLWDDFRLSGQDYLTWTPIPRPDDPARSVVVQLGITFEFRADSAGDIVVHDERDRPLEQLPAPRGRIRYRWSRRDPEPRTYSWQVRRIPP